jgi:hypothetical protein
VLTDIEWDLYDVSIDGATEGLDIAEACNTVPYALNPAADDELLLTLVPHTTNTLRVYVSDVSGSPVSGAQVDLSRSGFAETQTTSSCGQVFFNSGLTTASDYVLDVSALGYTSENSTDITIDGTSNITTSLSI